MLKYANVEVTFAEIPDHINLCINISNCPCHCVGCHSPYLADDIGYNLDENELRNLLNINKGITCVVFMGGDSEPDEIERLATFIKKEFSQLKTAWYSGRENITINLDSLDFIKVGPYKEEFGPLDKDTTNQVLYRIVHMSTGRNKLYDITYKFWKT